MNLQEEIKALKERIVELEVLAKEEQKFPQKYDDYWYVADDTEVLRQSWYNSEYDEGRLSIDNIFKTKEQAEFVVEKLKVEAELRKFSRPFKEGENNNWFILWNTYEKEVEIDWASVLVRQGTIYFESGKKAQQAIDAVGKDRVKKYIFGMEE